MTDVTGVIEFLMNLVNNAAGTVFEPYVSIIFIVIAIWTLLKLFLSIGKGIKKIYNYVSQNLFIRKKVYVNLSFMESADVYYAIKQFIPTRFSAKRDPGNDDEPAPIYADTNSEKDPLLIEHFCKFEFSQKNGTKYYLCLADCGMGKTTFLINLYYRMLKQGNYQCQFISLQEPSCLQQIDDIKEKGKKILLLDALDENNQALTSCSDFTEELEKKTREFYRVIITSRTNFFDSESKEWLSDGQKISGIVSKLPGVRKFYITPFTDEDIQHFLKLRYRLNRKKQKHAWKLIERNKNLSVRPLLLRFIEEVLSDDQIFEYDFQLYECLFQKWIDREKRSFSDEEGKEIYNECLNLAKAIYYQWMKNGQIGIYPQELPNNKFVVGLEGIQLKGHAMLNRTSDGIYKFSHRSYWEYMLAKLALSDVHFMDDLLIKNFDRAVSFLEEMIQYYQRHLNEQSYEVLMGIANYIMKYKKPEDAELQYDEAASLSNGQEQHQLMAMIHLAKCFHRQLKYKSAAEVLTKCQELMDNITLTTETLSIYVQFGGVFAEHCRINHLKSGQNFLQQVITYCENNNLINYDLFRCYEAYCYCSINHFFQQQALLQIDKLMNENFKDDQYINYLRNKAQIWMMDYKNPNNFKLMKKVEEFDKRFMDLYEQMIWYCNLGVSGVSVNKWNNVTVKYLEESYNISEGIYDDNNRKILQNPYATIIYQKTVLAYHVFKKGEQKNERDLEKECIDSILQYMKEYNMQEEMSVIQVMLLDYIRDDGLDSFEQMKSAVDQCIKIAETNGAIFDLINSYRNLYMLYSSKEETKVFGQQYLKRAYELCKDNNDYYMTNSYCDLLKDILSLYEGDIDKAAIARELIEITPEVYGNDPKRAQIYYELRKYYSARNNEREVKCCLELLCCEFGFYQLDDFYDSCKKYDCLGMFLEEVNRLFLEKGILSNDEVMSMRKFIDKRKNEVYIKTYNSLESLLKRNQSLQM